MIVEYPYTRRYLFTALAATPNLLAHLLTGISSEEADFRPDPERFTIREAIAHLADWEPIFLERLTRMVDEDNPLLPGIDEGELAVTNNYAETDLNEQLARFRAGRETLIAYLQTQLPHNAARVGDRPEIGTLTVEGLALIIPLHDTYHTTQIAEYRREFVKR